MSRQFHTDILLPGDPTLPLQAVPKQYVDARIGTSGFTYYQSTTPVGATVGHTWYDTATRRSFVYSGSAWIQTSFDPATTRMRLSPTTFPAGSTLVAATISATYNSDTSIINGVTATATIEFPVGGQYMITFNISAAVGGTSAISNYVQGVVYSNGNAGSVVCEGISPPAGPYMQIAGSSIGDIPAGDYITLGLAETHSSTVTIRQGNFSVTRVG